MSQKRTGFTIIEIIMTVFAVLVLGSIGFAVYRAHVVDPGPSVTQVFDPIDEITVKKTIDQQKNEALSVVKKVYDAYVTPPGTTDDVSAKAKQGAKDNGTTAVAAEIDGQAGYDAVICSQSTPVSFVYGEPVLALDGKSVSVPVTGTYKDAKETKLAVIVDTETMKLSEIICSKP